MINYSATRSADRHIGLCRRTLATCCVFVGGWLEREGGEEGRGVGGMRQRAVAAAAVTLIYR